jgi:hypothetical protein
MAAPLPESRLRVFPSEEPTERKEGEDGPLKTFAQVISLGKASALLELEFWPEDEHTQDGLSLGLASRLRLRVFVTPV